MFGQDDFVDDAYQNTGTKKVRKKYNFNVQHCLLRKAFFEKKFSNGAAGLEGSCGVKKKFQKTLR